MQLSNALVWAGLCGVSTQFIVKVPCYRGALKACETIYAKECAVFENGSEQRKCSCKHPEYSTCFLDYGKNNCPELKDYFEERTSFFCKEDVCIQEAWEGCLHYIDEGCDENLSDDEWDKCVCENPNYKPCGMNHVKKHCPVALDEAMEEWYETGGC